jgi:uncharacterized membrane protein YjfL (UPF0719 family)
MIMDSEWIETLAYLAMAIVLLAVGKLIRDVITPHDDDAELTTKDNAAYGITTAGYYLAIPIILLGAAWGETPPAPTWTVLGQELGLSAAYGLAGILALNLGRLIVDKALMPKFSMKKEVLEDRNAGAAAILFGSYLATACSIAGAVSGVGGGPETALVFFLLGQVTLILFGKIYQLVTSYDVHAEVEKDNVAAGVAFGANLIALGIIVGAASAGHFYDWAENLIDYGITVAFGLVLIIFVRFIADRILLPKASLAKEIAEDRNLAAAWLEGAAAVGMAMVLVVVL